MSAIPPPPAQQPFACASAAAAPVEEPYCKATALTFMDGSESLWHEVVAATVPELAVLLRDARAGLEAGDAVRLGRAVHTVKGLCACLAAEPARRAALALEDAAREGLAGAEPHLAVLADVLSHLVAALGAEPRPGAVAG